MPSLQNVVDRIGGDYLVRTDLDAAIVRAVQAAIRHYERKRWHWNETTTTLTASNGVATLSVPSDFLVLDLLEVQFQSASYALQRESFDFIKHMNAWPGGNNLPTRFTQRGATFEVAPIPDSAYLLNCHYLKQLVELTSASMTATNDWLSAAEDLIVYHATKIMWANVLRNGQEAAQYAQLERDAYTELKSYEEQRVTNSLRPTSF